MCFCCCFLPSEFHISCWISIFMIHMAKLLIIYSLYLAPVRLLCRYVSTFTSMNCFVFYLFLSSQFEFFAIQFFYTLNGIIYHSTLLQEYNLWVYEYVWRKHVESKTRYKYEYIMNDRSSNLMRRHHTSAHSFLIRMLKKIPVDLLFVCIYAYETIQTNIKNVHMEEWQFY